MAVLVIKSFKEDNKHNVFDLFDIEDAVYDGLNRNNEEYETYSIDENKLSFYKNRDYLFHNPELIVSLYEKMIKADSIVFLFDNECKKNIRTVLCLMRAFLSKDKSRGLIGLKRKKYLMLMYGNSSYGQYGSLFKDFNELEEISKVLWDFRMELIDVILITFANIHYIRKIIPEAIITLVNFSR